VLEAGDRMMVLGDEEDLEALRPTPTAAPEQPATGQAPATQPRSV
jgi:hypothetical protein